MNSESINSMNQSSQKLIPEYQLHSSIWKESFLLAAPKVIGMNVTILVRKDSEQLKKKLSNKNELYTFSLK